MTGVLQVGCCCGNKGAEGGTGNKERQIHKQARPIFLFLGVYFWVNNDSIDG